jgi:hypothetical protein
MKNIQTQIKKNCIKKVTYFWKTMVPPSPWIKWKGMHKDLNLLMDYNLGP